MASTTSEPSASSASLLRPIIPFFMNPPASQFVSPNNETSAIASSLASTQPPSRSSGNLNTTDWSFVNTTLGIQFKIPPHWVAKQFGSNNTEAGSETNVINFTSPDSDNSFFVVNVTDNIGNNQTTLDAIAESIGNATQNIIKRSTATLSGLPAYHIISVREVGHSTGDQITVTLLNVTDFIATQNNMIYHIKYGAEVGDIASFSIFRDVLESVEIDNSQSLPLNRTMANQTQLQNVSSSIEEDNQNEEEGDDNNDDEDNLSLAPVPLESSQQSQSSSPSFGSPSIQQQSPYMQAPNVPFSSQNPYGQPMISSPYSSYSQQRPPYFVPQNPVVPPPYFPPVQNPTGCQGLIGCFSGTVVNVVDGDTVDININNVLNNERIRLSLVDTPETGEAGFEEAKSYTQSQCIPGTEVLVDQDAGQPQDSSGRMLGVMYCGIINISNRITLNELLLQQGFAVIDRTQCSISEFSTTPWAQLYGCGQLQGNCDPSYPFVCIPSPPPTLTCLDINQRNFVVIGNDPHNFDNDNDGVGCEI